MNRFCWKKLLKIVNPLVLTIAVVFVSHVWMLASAQAQELTDEEKVARCEALKASQPAPPGLDLSKVTCEVVVAKSKPRRTKTVRIVNKKTSDLATSGGSQ